MTPNDLQAARDLVAAATPGPWAPSESLVGTEYGTYVAHGVTPVAPLERYADSDGAHTALEVMDKADAELIAAAPDLITKLLDHVAALETKFEQMQAKAITSEVGLYREIENSQRLGTERDKARNSLNGVTRTRDRYAAQVAAVRDLHQPAESIHRIYCDHCQINIGHWPCPTIQALDEESPPDLLDPTTLN